MTTYEGPITPGMHFTGNRSYETFQIKGVEGGIVTSFRPRSGDREECHVRTLETWFRQVYQPKPVRQHA